MGDVRVNIAYFFQNPEGFPWDVLGLSRPYAGPLHGYLCDAALLFCDRNDALILKQRPALFEIRKFGKNPESILSNIANLCNQSGEVVCRFTKAQIVVNWLNSQPDFRKFMQSRLDMLWRQGLISIPEGARPFYDPTD